MTIREVVSPLNGKQFSNMEELENAILPIFGPIQAGMTGQSYRDFIDKMISVKWIVRNGEGYKIVIPELPVEETTKWSGPLPTGDTRTFGQPKLDEVAREIKQTDEIDELLRMHKAFCQRHGNSGQFTYHLSNYANFEMWYNYVTKLNEFFHAYEESTKDQTKELDWL